MLTQQTPRQGTDYRNDYPHNAQACAITPHVHDELWSISMYSLLRSHSVQAIDQETYPYMLTYLTCKWIVYRSAG